METGYLNFHDEEHFSDFSLSLGQHNLLDDSQSSLLAIDDDFDYVEARMDTSGGLWGDEQELNGDMAVLPVSGVASVIPKIENMKEDFAKVLTDWQEHIGYLQASDMGEDIDMAELSMGIPEKLNTDLPEDIFQSETSETCVNTLSSPMKKRQRDFTNTRSPKSKTISESSSQDIDVIGLDSSEDIEPVLDLMHVDCDHASSLSADIDCELLAAARGKADFDLAAYITRDDDLGESPPPSVQDSDPETPQPDVNCKSILKINEKGIDALIVSPVKVEPHEASSDNEDAVDVETVVEQMPVLEAGDVKSLLEQFEASEASAVRPVDRTSKAAVTDISNASMKLSIGSKKGPVIEKVKPTPLLKSAETQDSKFHKNIRDSLPKEVIDRIKASARKKVISVIPALSGPRVGGSRSTRMQEAAATLSRTKLLKIVANGAGSSGGRVDGSVQLDHDYCSSSGNSSSASSVIGNSESSESGIATDVGMAEITSSFSCNKTTREDENSRNATKPVGYYVPISEQKKDDNPRKSSMKKDCESAVTKRCGDRAWGDCGSKKDSGLESGEVSDASEETASNLTLAGDANRNSAENVEKACSSSTFISTTNTHGAPNNGKLRGVKATTKEAPVYEMKIRSALATSILQLRKGVLTKTKSFEAGHTHNKVKQMVSVLKKPPNIVASHPNESIVTTKNSSNNEVQNIIVRQETNDRTTDNNEFAALETDNAQEEVKKPPPRRKLNLAEYRSRREQCRSDNSRTCSPIQPMTLVYIHHASTTTEPCRDDPENPVWSEREIVSVLKPKAEFEEEKNREKQPTREMAIQTGEATRTENNREENQLAKMTIVTTTATTATTASSSSLTGERADSETRVTRPKERKNRRYRRRRTSSSSTSRSRSRSPTDRERSRSRSRNKSRSRSRRCSSSSNPRRRRISHRRSSVSSSSSWSSRSRSHTRSTSRSRSRSRSLRSRSRSSRSRSRSRSSSRYSSCSSRSPRRSYRRQYDTWYHKEKKRQMEERRVIYVGRLDENTTKADLRRRFETFGPVLDISVHFREHGDNYGFVTFAYKNDAYEAVEHGNDDPSLPRYDLSFGGRRAFCKVKYADLDGMAGNSLTNPVNTPRSIIKSDEDNTFDLLLKEAKAKLRKRKV